MERLKAVRKDHKRRLEFLETVIKEEAHLEPSRSGNNKRISPHVWQKTVGIIFAHNSDVDMTLKDAAAQWGLSRERGRQMNKDGLIRMHENLSEKNRQKFPLKTILSNKPLSQAFCERLSAEGSGLSLRIKAVAKTGITDPDKIASKLGTTRRKVMGRRKILLGWGIELKKKRKSHADLREKIKRAKTNEKRQKILDDIPAMVLRGMIDKDRRMGEQAIFGRVGNILRELGFDYRQANLVVEVLRSVGLVVRSLNTGYKIRQGKCEYEQYCYICLAKDEERIKATIFQMEASEQKLGNGKLRRVRVKLTYGTRDDRTTMPSTFALQNHMGFQSAKEIIKEITGICVGKSKAFKYQDLLSGSPVEVWGRGGGLYFPTSKAEELKAFIAKRYQDLLSMNSN